MKRSFSSAGLLCLLAVMAISSFSCRQSGPAYALIINGSHTYPADHPVSIYNDALSHRKPIVMVFTQQGSS